MRCYKCGNDYDSDAMTCPFCGQRNFVDRIPGTEEECKGEDLFVAWNTRSIPMFLNIADRFVRKVLRVEKIIICVFLLVTVFILVVAPAFGAAVRFIRKDSVLGELSTLYEQEQFTLLVDRMRNGGYMGKERFGYMRIIRIFAVPECHIRRISLTVSWKTGQSIILLIP